MSSETTHNKAMELAEEADAAKRQGNVVQYKSLLREAYEQEKGAANAYLLEESYEPTRSVLFRSAASLAVELEEWRSAEQLIAAALYGNPPQEIADELRDLLETVNFRRHLDLRGLTLSEAEFQMSLTGDGIGLGIALTELFVQRVDDVGRLVRRTAERVFQRPYREHGRLEKQLQDNFSLFVSVPRAGSFAVTFHVGSSRQASIPGEDMGGRVVDEVVDCLEVLQDKGEAGLTSKIEDEAYRRNFIGLARSLAPDGRSVKSVGFTSNSKGRIRKFSLNVLRQEIGIRPEMARVGRPIPNRELVIVTGYLRYADSRDEKQGVIDLIDDNKHEHKVLVPSGMMSDIVRPLYETRVIVEGYKTRNSIALEKIDRAPDETN